MLKTKRAYEMATEDDGKRIFVDRLWPRGLSKKDFLYDGWFKDIAPSNVLREWFEHEPEKFQEFKRQYTEELSSPERQDILQHIASWAENGPVTLVYGAKDTERNNAAVLVEVIEKKMRTRAV